MILHELQIWIDQSPRRPAEQMALDESIFSFGLQNKIAVLRSYQWQEPAVTIGYFDEYPENENRPVIRRMTGGGLVNHGEDITFCLALPPGCEPTMTTTENRYRWIHESLSQVLADFGAQLNPENQDLLKRGPCFSKPVKWDLINERGQKLVGGAQRKSHGGVIHQGSILLDRKPPVSLDMAKHWIRDLASILAREVSDLSPSAIYDLEQNSQNFENKKYASEKWTKFRQPGD